METGLVPYGFAFGTRLRARAKARNICVDYVPVGDQFVIADSQQMMLGKNGYKKPAVSPTAPVTCVAYADEVKATFVSSMDGYVRAFVGDTFSQVHATPYAYFGEPAQPLLSLLYDGENMTLVAISPSGLAVWALQPVNRAKRAGMYFRVHKVSFMTSDTATFKCGAVLEGDEFCVAFGRSLAIFDVLSGDYKRSVLLLSPDPIECVTAVHTRLAIGTDSGQVVLYDTTSWEALQCVQAHTSPVARIYYTAPRPDREAARTARASQRWLAASQKMRAEEGEEGNAEHREVPELNGEDEQVITAPPLPPKQPGAAGGERYLEGKKTTLLRTLITGGSDGHVRVWNQGFELVYSLPLAGLVRGITCPSATKLCIASEELTEVWNFDPNSRTFARARKPVVSILSCPVDDVMLYVTESSGVHVASSVTAVTQTFVHIGKEEGIADTSYDSSRQLLHVLLFSNALVTYDLRCGKEIGRWSRDNCPAFGELTLGCAHLDLSEEYRASLIREGAKLDDVEPLLVTGTEFGTISLFSAASTNGKVLRRYQGHRSYIRCVEFDHTSQLIATCDDFTVRVWSLVAEKFGTEEEGNERVRLGMLPTTGFDLPCRGIISLCHRGGTVVAGTEHGLVAVLAQGALYFQLYNQKGNNFDHTLIPDEDDNVPGPPVVVVDYSPNTGVALALALDGTITFIDVEDRVVLSKLMEDELPAAVSFLNGQGDVVVGKMDGSIELIRTAQYLPLKRGGVVDPKKKVDLSLEEKHGQAYVAPTHTSDALRVTDHVVNTANEFDFVPDDEVEAQGDHASLPDDVAELVGKLLGRPTAVYSRQLAAITMKAVLNGELTVERTHWRMLLVALDAIARSLLLHDFVVSSVVSICLNEADAKVRAAGCATLKVLKVEADRIQRTMIMNELGKKRKEAQSSQQSAAENLSPEAVELHKEHYGFDEEATLKQLEEDHRKYRNDIFMRYGAPILRAAHRLHQHDPVETVRNSAEDLLACFGMQKNTKFDDILQIYMEMEEEVNEGEKLWKFRRSHLKSKNNSMISDWRSTGYKKPKKSNSTKSVRPSHSRSVLGKTGKARVTKVAKERRYMEPLKRKAHLYQKPKAKSRKGRRHRSTSNLAGAASTPVKAHRRSRSDANEQMTREDVDTEGSARSTERTETEDEEESFVSDSVRDDNDSSDDVDEGDTGGLASWNACQISSWSRQFGPHTAAAMRDVDGVALTKLSEHDLVKQIGLSSSEAKALAGAAEALNDAGGFREWSSDSVACWAQQFGEECATSLRDLDGQTLAKSSAFQLFEMGLSAQCVAEVVRAVAELAGTGVHALTAEEVRAWVTAHVDRASAEALWCSGLTGTALATLTPKRATTTYGLTDEAAQVVVEKSRRLLGSWGLETWTPEEVARWARREVSTDAGDALAASGMDGLALLEITRARADGLTKAESDKLAAAVRAVASAADALSDDRVMVCVDEDGAVFYADVLTGQPLEGGDTGAATSSVPHIAIAGSVSQRSGAEHEVQAAGGQDGPGGRADRAASPPVPREGRDDATPSNTSPRGLTLSRERALAMGRPLDVDPELSPRSEVFNKPDSEYNRDDWSTSAPSSPRRMDAWCPASHHGEDPHDLGPHDLGPHDLGPHDLDPHDLDPHDLGPHDLGPGAQDGWEDGRTSRHQLAPLAGAHEWEDGSEHGNAEEVEVSWERASDHGENEEMWEEASQHGDMSPREEAFTSPLTAIGEEGFPKRRDADGWEMNAARGVAGAGEDWDNDKDLATGHTADPAADESPHRLSLLTHGTWSSHGDSTVPPPAKGGSARAVIAQRSGGLRVSAVASPAATDSSGGEGAARARTGGAGSRVQERKSPSALAPVTVDRPGHTYDAAWSGPLTVLSPEARSPTSTSPTGPAPATMRHKRRQSPRGVGHASAPARSSAPFPSPTVRGAASLPPPRTTTSFNNAMFDLSSYLGGAAGGTGKAIIVARSPGPATRARREGGETSPLTEELHVLPQRSASTPLVLPSSGGPSVRTTTTTRLSRVEGPSMRTRQKREHRHQEYYSRNGRPTRVVGPNLNAYDRDRNRRMGHTAKPRVLGSVPSLQKKRGHRARVDPSGGGGGASRQRQDPRSSLHVGASSLPVLSAPRLAANQRA